jgi:hypothetical protein
MGNTKFVEALVAGGGGVAGDDVGNTGIDQGRDEEGMAASGFGDKDEGRKIMPTDEGSCNQAHGRLAD